MHELWNPETVLSAWPSLSFFHLPSVELSIVEANSQSTFNTFFLFSLPWYSQLYIPTYRNNWLPVVNWVGRGQVQREGERIWRGRQLTFIVVLMGHRNLSPIIALLQFLYIMSFIRSQHPLKQVASPRCIEEETKVLRCSTLSCKVTKPTCGIPETDLALLTWPRGLVLLSPSFSFIQLKSPSMFFYHKTHLGLCFKIKIWIECECNLLAAGSISMNYWTPGPSHKS